MKYLAYYQDGFSKKFPLKNGTLFIGRGADNDLTIDDSYLSRVHLRIENTDEITTIHDLDSVNGTFFHSQRISKTEIHPGDSFTAGRTELFLMEGSEDEFTITQKIAPPVSTSQLLSHSQHSPHHTQKLSALTDSTCNACSQLLEDILSQGYGKRNMTDFLSFLSARLTELDNLGSLFLIWMPGNIPHILLSVENHQSGLDLFKTATKEYPDLFKHPHRFLPLSPISHRSLYVYSYPFKMQDKHAALLYITPQNQKHDDFQLEKFLSTLCKEVELIAQIYKEREKERGNKKIMPSEKDEPSLFSNDIVAVSASMKQLIHQAKRLAGSDLFVLINGESGTGKELFARLIHNCSPRNDKQFIALNCAAIPEHLLEAELFGHEKGAFTGAHAQRKGKLELASGGTLVLDEIGDMPLNLQTKLLRALQEKEFYRLGASTPIKVDLRIISLTHQDLKQLIKEKKFREDLYFRLVHRPLIIPPLRERKEDIPILINHFTNKYCRLANKNVMGFSVKAFEALLHYHWRGNVRELENEINSLVNLTDDNDMIAFDMLSEEIKYSETHASQEPRSLHFNEKPTKEIILEFLEKHNWNKSETARALNMTYQGLHKKMSRLGLN